jgi:benzoate-CoA ligase
VPPGEIGTLVITRAVGGRKATGACATRAARPSSATRSSGGDKFHVDTDGYFWFCGRGDDMLKCSGVYVSPVEVENCLLGHPAVHEAGVVGYRDAAGLEKAVAFVELASGHVATARRWRPEILAHARTNIAAFKAPRRMEFVETPAAHRDRARSSAASCASSRSARGMT